MVGIVVPVLKKTLEGEKSNVEIKDYHILEDGLSLIAYNTGTKPGYISSVKIILSDSVPQKALRSFNLDLRHPSQTRVVVEKSINEKFFALKRCHFLGQVLEHSKMFKKGIDDENFLIYVQLVVNQYDGTNTWFYKGPSKAKDFFWNINSSGCAEERKLIEDLKSGKFYQNQL